MAGLLVLSGLAGCGDSSQGVTDDVNAQVGSSNPVESDEWIGPDVPPAAPSTSSPPPPTRPAAEPSVDIRPSPGMQRGTWPDAVQFELPVAPGALDPTLTVVAEHTVSDGVVGPGHRLLGASVIHHRSATGGVPGTSDGDVYVLDGTRLVDHGDGTWGLEREDGSELTYDAGSNTWEQRRAGWTMVYGAGDGESRATKHLTGHLGCPFGSRCATAAWYLSEVVDPRGHSMFYEYSVTDMPAELSYADPTAADHVLSRIRYGAPEATVELTYETRPDTAIDLSSGRATLSLLRLDRVTTYAGSGQMFSDYDLEYHDEAGLDCALESVPVELAPKRSWLRRIVRQAGDASDLRRTLRCYEVHEELERWEAPKKLSSAPMTYPFSWSFGASGVAPTPANINGDGLTDLVLLTWSCPGGGAECEVDHQVFEARPTDGDPVFTSTDLSRGWEEQLEARLDGAFFADHRGHAFVDLDTDGWPELVWETAEGGVEVLRYDPYGHRLYGITTDLSGCDLRFSTFVDIDGDGRPDMVSKAHTEGRDRDDVEVCPARSDSRFWRNQGGVAPFVAAEWQPLMLPATSSSDVGGAVVRPSFTGLRWDDDATFIADQTRLLDLNADGLADALVALYREWGPGEGGQDAPDLATAFSRIYWGDGHGAFVDSGLSAGAPFLGLSLPPADDGSTIPRLYSHFSTALDVDRDGRPDLLGPQAVTAGSVTVGGARFHNLVDGYGFAEGGGVTAGTDLAFDFEVKGLDFAGAGDACFKRAVFPAFGDFDGGGFPDLLRFEWNDAASTSGCGTTGWCVSYSQSRREAAQGRVVAATNSWGGRTELSWGFSATEGHDNPDLPFNVEVLEEVDGASGVVSFRYGKGVTGRDGFGGFGVIERINARGGSERFGFATTPAMGGAPVYAARYRLGGGLDAMTAWVHGRPVDGEAFGVDISPPYANPLIRQCEFEVERDSGGASTVDVGDLVRACHGYGLDEEAMPSNAQLLVAAGYLRYPRQTTGSEETTPYTLSQMLWESEDPATRVDLGHLDTPLTGATWELPWTASDERLPVDYRLDLPDGLAAPPTPALATDYEAETPEEAYGSGYSAWVVEHVYDDEGLRLETLDVRDPLTPADDLLTTYVWHVDPADRTRRRIAEIHVETGAGVLQQSTVRSDFDPASVDDARRVEVCGPSGTDCQVHEYTFHADGRLASHRWPDGSEETWDYTALCGTTTHTNLVGIERVAVHDGRCRPVEEAVSGAVVEYEYDGLNRVVQRTETSAAAGTTAVWTHLYDDTETLDSDGVVLRSAVLGPQDALSTERRDGFGRLVRATSCLNAGGDTSAPALRDRVSCTEATKLHSTYRAYGTDGLLRATAAPYYPGEGRLTLLSRSLHGELAMVTAPSHDAETAPDRWTLESRLYRAPGRLIELDALGRASQLVRTTLSRESWLAGNLMRTETLDAAGRLIRRAETDGIETVYTHDEMGRVASEQRVQTAKCLPLGSAHDAEVPSNCMWRRDFTYDAFGRVASTTAPDGTVTEIDRDPLGRLLARRHLGPDGEDLGQSLEVSLDDGPAGTTEVATEEAGGWLRTVRDGFGRTLERETSLGIRTVYTWGPWGPTAISIEDGSLTLARVQDYDDHGRLSSVTDPRRGTTTYDLRADGRIAATTDGDDVTVTRTFAQSGELRATWLGDWLLGRVTHDEAGRVATRETASGLRVYDRDELGRVTRVERGQPALAGEALTYEGQSARIATRTRWPVADGGEATWTYAYSGWGRVERLTDPHGAETVFASDPDGRPRSIQDALGARVYRSYDLRGRPARVDRPGRGFIADSYEVGVTRTRRAPDGGEDAALTRIEHEDAAGHTWTQYLDAAGRRVALDLPDGTSQEWHYDGSRLSDHWVVDAGGVAVQHTAYVADASGRITLTSGPVDPGSGLDPAPTTAVVLTAAGRTTSVDINGVETLYGYDDDGLAVTETFDGLVRTLERVHAGLGSFPRISATHLAPVGGGPTRTMTPEYDALGRMVGLVVEDGTSVEESWWTELDTYGSPRQTGRTTAPAGAADPDAEVQELWSWDELGRPLERRTQVNGDELGSTHWTWLLNGAAESISGPSGRTMTYEYGDPFDFELERVKLAGGNTLAEVVARDPRGDVTAMTVGGEQRELAYDALGRKTFSASLSPGGTTMSSSTFVRDALGRVTSESVEDWAGTGVSWTTAYTYDGAGRLQREERLDADSNSLGWLEYEHDVAGRRLRTLDEDGVRMEATWVDNRLEAVDGVPVVYDAWLGVLEDQHGQVYGRSASGLVQAVTANGVTTAMWRNATGLPVALDEGGDGAELRWNVWGLDPAARPIEVQDEAGAFTSTFMAEGMLMARLDPDGPSTLRGDAVGDLEAIDGAVVGATLSAFGEALGPVADSERFLFAGMERLPHAADVYFARFRAYDPQTGRFLSPDPLGLAGGPHRTQYAEGDPVQFVDPLGLSACESDPVHMSAPDLAKRSYSTAPIVLNPLTAPEWATPAALPAVTVNLPATTSVFQQAGDDEGPCGTFQCPDDDPLGGGGDVSSIEVAAELSMGSALFGLGKGRKPGRKERRAKRKQRRAWMRYARQLARWRKKNPFASADEADEANIFASPGMGASSGRPVEGDIYIHPRPPTVPSLPGPGTPGPENSPPEEEPPPPALDPGPPLVEVADERAGELGAPGEPPAPVREPAEVQEPERIERSKVVPAAIPEVKPILPQTEDGNPLDQEPGWSPEYSYYEPAQSDDGYVAPDEASLLEQLGEGVVAMGEFFYFYVGAFIGGADEERVAANIDDYCRDNPCDSLTDGTAMIGAGLSDMLPDFVNADPAIDRTAEQFVVVGTTTIRGREYRVTDVQYAGEARNRMLFPADGKGIPGGAPGGGIVTTKHGTPGSPYLGP